jgi:hypothetical protein
LVTGKRRSFRQSHLKAMRFVHYVDRNLDKFRDGRESDALRPSLFLCLRFDNAQIQLLDGVNDERKKGTYDTTRSRRLSESVHGNAVAVEKDGGVTLQKNR